MISDRTYIKQNLEPAAAPSFAWKLYFLNKSQSELLNQVKNFPEWL